MSGSLTTAETIIRRVQRDFGDEAETQIRLDDIFDWINFGQLEIVRQTECLESEIEYTLNPAGDPGKVELKDGVPRLVIPEDFLLEQKLIYNGGTELTKVQFQDTYPTQTSTSGTTPNQYYIRSGRMSMIPVPALDSKKMTLYYVVKPSEVHNVSDTLDIPSNFVLDLVEYCTMKAKELAEDYQHANLIGGRLATRLATSKNEANVPSDSYAVVRDDANDFW